MGVLIFISAQLTSKTNPVYISYCRSGSRHVGRGKKKRKMERAFLRSHRPCSCGSLPRPPFLNDCLAQQEPTDSQELKEWELHFLAAISVVKKATLLRGLKASVIL